MFCHELQLICVSWTQPSSVVNPERAKFQILNPALTRYFLHAGDVALNGLREIFFFCN